MMAALQYSLLKDYDYRTVLLMFEFNVTQYTTGKFHLDLDSYEKAMYSEVWSLFPEKQQTYERGRT
jgi:hypothetical protein